jgi:hypothetical protein
VSALALLEGQMDRWAGGGRGVCVLPRRMDRWAGINRRTLWRERCSCVAAGVSFGGGGADVDRALPHHRQGRMPVIATFLTASGAFADWQWPDASLADLQAPHGGEGRVVVGRHDYVVRSVDAETGAERWNVTYARLVQLDPTQLLGRTEPDGLPMQMQGSLALGSKREQRPPAGIEMSGMCLVLVGAHGRTLFGWHTRQDTGHCLAQMQSPIPPRDGHAQVLTQGPCISLETLADPGVQSRGIVSADSIRDAESGLFRRRWRCAAGHVRRLPVALLTTGSPALLVGPHNSLRCLDPKTGEHKWAIRFASAPVAAYAEGGSVNTLLGHPVPRPVAPNRGPGPAEKDPQFYLPETPAPHSFAPRFLYAPIPPRVSRRADAWSDLLAAEATAGVEGGGGRGQAHETCCACVDSDCLRPPRCAVRACCQASLGASRRGTGAGRLWWSAPWAAGCTHCRPHRGASTFRWSPTARWAQQPRGSQAWRGRACVR